MSRHSTIDQTPTDRFDPLTLPLPTDVPEKAPKAIRRRPRKPTWGEAWNEEIHRREFQIYAMVCFVVGVAIVFVMVSMSASLPSRAPQAAGTSPVATSHADTPRTVSEAPVMPVRPQHTHHTPVTPRTSSRPSHKHSAPPATTPTHTHHRSGSPSPTASHSTKPPSTKPVDPPTTPTNTGTAKTEDSPSAPSSPPPS